MDNVGRRMDARVIRAKTIYRDQDTSSQLLQLNQLHIWETVMAV